MVVALYNKLPSLLKDDLQFYAYTEKNVLNFTLSAMWRRVLRYISPDILSH
jgi:hypothetical protein